MTERQIFESERYPDFKKFSNLDEDLAKLLIEKKYHEIIQKCQHMSMSKSKYIILCYAYLGLKEWKHLIESCEKGLQFDINQPDFYSLKAKSLGKLGKHHEKILLLQKAINLDGKVPSYYRNLGSAYISIQNYPLACKEYDKAIQLQPDNIFNYHNKGVALFKYESYVEAKKYFLLALQKNPNVALSYSWLADCQKKLGNLEEAEKLLSKAYQISHNSVYLQENQKLQKQIQLKKHEGKWYYSIAWLTSKLI